MQAFTRLILFLGVTLVRAIIFLTRRALAPAAKARELGRRESALWGTWIGWALGIQVRVEGPVPVGGVLLAPNHLGYGDIPAIMTAADCHVMTKTEVAETPGVRHIVRLAQIPYIMRRQSRELADVSRGIGERVAGGDRICAFLEGTSTAGDRVLPIRTTILQGLIDAGAVIVPVGLVWQGPPGCDRGEEIAYWKDHQFAPHFRRFRQLHPLVVTVRFGQPIRAGEWNRKALATELRTRIAELAGVPFGERVDAPQEPPA